MPLPLADISEITQTVEETVGPNAWETSLRLAFLILIGLPLCFALSRLGGRFIKKRFSQHVGLIVQKAILFAGLISIAVSVMLEFGFKLGALLGAAGIVSVAVGFASQTSLSNIISGLFLYGEKPFSIGDVIKVGDTTGIVLSIDLLSVKLRQFDNQFVRIPNETMVKAQVTTVTKFPVRRLDIEVGVAYKEDIDHVIRTLKKAADSNTFCLDEPAPVVIFRGFGDSSLNFTLGAWCERTQFLDLRNTLMRDVKKLFDAEGIEIPFPQRVVHMHEKSAPAEPSAPRSVS
ncbi:mechanosensitive ion channel family protein [Pelagicoccus sp. SDUM812003]|uniref:mechanosensitive ion channel family protein n=1 Tax=Pelagicoccus sp. SDUM812003 TaxID=3041267 RepID=UPI00280FA5BF|nr:mechanosensitive ion channel family protein [Pelagicoccus sp. SDUM812003]MDQ8205506.1 mechanosensitive ion channel family protein [Pelagicoccus sp. SDUM812003]